MFFSLQDQLCVWFKCDKNCIIGSVQYNIVHIYVFKYFFIYVGTKLEVLNINLNLYLATYVNMYTVWQWRTNSSLAKWQCGKSVLKTGFEKQKSEMRAMWSKPWSAFNLLFRDFNHPFYFSHPLNDQRSTSLTHWMLMIWSLH